MDVDEIAKTLYRQRFGHISTLNYVLGIFLFPTLFFGVLLPGNSVIISFVLLLGLIVLSIVSKYVLGFALLVYFLNFLLFTYLYLTHNPGEYVTEVAEKLASEELDINFLITAEKVTFDEFDERGENHLVAVTEDNLQVLSVEPDPIWYKTQKEGVKIYQEFSSDTDENCEVIDDEEGIKICSTSNKFILKGDVDEEGFLSRIDDMGIDIKSSIDEEGFLSRIEYRESDVSGERSWEQEPQERQVSGSDAGNTEEVTWEEYLEGMDPQQFEELISDLWQAQGWETSVTSGSIDRGIDVIASKDHPFEQKILIQAKKYKSSNLVGSPQIQQYASLKHQENNVDQVVVVTTSEFSSQAKETARDLNVKLVSGSSLKELLNEYMGSPPST